MISIATIPVLNMASFIVHSSSSSSSNTLVASTTPATTNIHTISITTITIITATTIRATTTSIIIIFTTISTGVPSAKKKAQVFETNEEPYVLFRYHRELHNRKLNNTGFLNPVRLGGQNFEIYPCKIAGH